jgi:hypothetical protein
MCIPVLGILNPWHTDSLSRMQDAVRYLYEDIYEFIHALESPVHFTDDYGRISGGDVDRVVRFHFHINGKYAIHKHTQSDGSRIYVDNRGHIYRYDRARDTVIISGRKEDKTTKLPDIVIDHIQESGICANIYTLEDIRRVEDSIIKLAQNYTANSYNLDQLADRIAKIRVIHDKTAAVLYETRGGKDSPDIEKLHSSASTISCESYESTSPYQKDSKWKSTTLPYLSFMMPVEMRRT